MRTIPIAAALAATGLLACATPIDRSADAVQPLAYSLATIDARPLPHLQVEGSSIALQEITEGMLVLRRDGTFFMELSYIVARAGENARTSRVHEGVWFRLDDDFTFEFDSGEVSNARLRDGVIEMSLDGRRFGWRR